MYLHSIDNICPSYYLRRGSCSSPSIALVRPHPGSGRLVPPAGPESLIPITGPLFSSSLLLLLLLLLYFSTLSSLSSLCHIHILTLPLSLEESWRLLSTRCARRKRLVRLLSLPAQDMGEHMLTNDSRQNRLPRLRRRRLCPALARRRLGILLPPQTLRRSQGPESCRGRRWRCPRCKSFFILYCIACLLPTADHPPLRRPPNFFFWWLVLLNKHPTTTRSTSPDDPTILDHFPIMLSYASIEYRYD